MTCIKIEKRQLSFRDEARLISDQIKKDDDKSIALDFSKTGFISRSFLDELLNVLEELKKQKRSVKIVNLKPELRNFFQQVAKTKAKIKKELQAAV